MAVANRQKVAVVAGISAGIGSFVARRLTDDGWSVVGTSRNGGDSPAPELSAVTTLACDFSDRASVRACASQFSELGRRWDLLFSSVGTMVPIGPFFSLPFDAWRENVEVNALGQLEFLHKLYPMRNQDGASVALLAGGGTNGPFDNYSAYCLSKIMLIKMCELIHHEARDINCFIIGPGYVNTRIHQETFAAGGAAGSGLAKTEQFVTTPGTDMEDIYQHLRWCMAAGRDVSGGRNHSTVHDPWGTSRLAGELRADPDMYRLRRYRGFGPHPSTERAGESR